MKSHLSMLLLIGVWIGMILGISFLEAPLKFQAQDISLAQGLGIGRIVFSALNKVEWIIVILVALCSVKAPLTNNLALIPPVIILALQTFWLLPILDERAVQIISGKTLATTYHHITYIVSEVLKVISLIYLFIKAYNHG